MDLRILTTLFLVLLLFGCNNNNNSDDLDLSSNFRTIIEYCYLQKDNPNNKPDKQYEYRRVYKFDKTGNQLIQKYYNSDNKFQKKMVFTYDQYGNLSTESIYALDGDMIMRSRSSYDKNNNCIKYSKRYFHGRDHFGSKTEYDQKGNIIEQIITIDNNGSFEKDVSIRKFKYDNQGNIIEENEFDLSGNLLKRKTLKYDDNNREIEHIQIFYSGPNKGNKTHWIFRYDEYGNMIEWVANDSKSNQSTVYKYEYQFDNKNNWIKKIIYIDGIPEKYYEREIKYY